MLLGLPGVLSGVSKNPHMAREKLHKDEGDDHPYFRIDGFVITLLGMLLLALFILGRALMS